MTKPKVIAIVGPTSSGKTSLSIKIAKAFNGEVISADSRQVYQGMDLGTGKVTTEEMNGIPHHLLSIVDPMTIYTGADFKRDAANTIATILKNDRVPVIAGGTFFYIELLRGTMQSAPVPPDPLFRASLDSCKTEALYEILKEKDAHRAATIDRDNRRRLIRSLEIINTLGTVPEARPVESLYEWLLIGIDIPKEKLHENIRVRLRERLKAGMIEEVKTLNAEGVSWERMAELGLEYRCIATYLKGTGTKEELVVELETKNKQLAKRQMTWLKKDTAIEWFDPKNELAIMERVETFLHNS
jgi:tRNA dimethylallyltransferase